MYIFTRVYYLPTRDTDTKPKPGTHSAMQSADEEINVEI